MLPALLGWAPAARAQAPARCFPEAAPAIADCVAGRIGQFWAQQGGLPVFGYPIGPEHQEQTDAGPLTLQLFERARLELHPQNAPPYDVQLGRLGADALARQGRDWSASPTADAAAPHRFAETGHAIAPEFWAYWSGHGLEFDGRRGTSFAESLALFGMPLTEAQPETSPTDGKQYLTQWFERARFEYHPENAGTPYTVLLGLLQRELQGPAAPSAAPASAAPGGFIQASGGQLTRQGAPVTLRGVNYYPQWWPWSEMWRQWDAPQIERELRQARDQLGINAVRVLLPFNFSGQPEGRGAVPPVLIARLRELAQIAGEFDMRLIVTLFDFSHDFPDAGSSVERLHLDYLRALIPAFAGDERIMAWDLHNEPDNYEIWKDGDQQKVLGWLGRMADAVHALAPNQLVTVGMGQPASLWLSGPDGRRVIDYSDVVSMHTYDAGAGARDLDQLRAQTSKPILIEEFGWPTGPDCVENYSEATQVALFQAVVQAARGRTSGVLAWTLRDYDSGPTDRWDSREEHFGLFRADGSLKPAADQLRAIPAGPLPSAPVAAVPLTSREPQLPSGDDAPLLVPGSGHYVKGVFRRAWELAGGLDSFGLPLTEAFERPSDHQIVQYFEGGALESRRDAPSRDVKLPADERVRQTLRPLNLGEVFAAGRALPPAAPPQGAFRAAYDRVGGEWRLGQPISGELSEQIDGAPARVQYFQRGRLELRAGAQEATVGALGRDAWAAQCAAAR
jgi:hypothetical protein